MRPDLILKNRKLNHIIGVIGIILSIVVIFLALKNVSWVYRLVAVCAIIYCLIDIEQKLEEDHAITQIDRNIIVVIGSFYIGFSIICAILLIIYAFIAFWIILLALTLLYNLIHLIVRIKVERGPTNRQF